MAQRLVLVGGGHAHLFVLEGLARGRFPAVRAVLLSPTRTQAYSGMVPGLIGGRYRPEELEFDLAAMARAAGAELIVGRAARLHPDQRQVELDDGRRIGYDVLSLAIGSEVAGADLPGVRSLALFVKPIDCAEAIIPALEQAGAGGGPLRAVVVGGGAAGVEIALAVRARLRLLGRPDAQVTLVGGGERVLGEQSPSSGRQAAEALRVNAVAVRIGVEVREAAGHTVRLSDGGELPAEVLIWATGPAAPGLFDGSGLATDARGFLLVCDHLESVSHPGVFAAGDVATLQAHPKTPKAGVFAVRAGPLLRDNLRAALESASQSRPTIEAGAGTRLKSRRYRSYKPQQQFLALLNTGDGRAILSYGPVALTARWAMWLKDWIDRRFMRRFQQLCDRAEGLEDTSVPPMHRRLAELVQYAEEQRSVLLAAVDAVPAALHERGPGAELWSVAGVLDHLHRVEAGVAKLVRRRLREAKDAGLGPERETASVLTCLDNFRLADRSRSVAAPETVQPRAEVRAQDALDGLRASRTALLSALAAGDGLALGTVVHPHPLLGPLTLYQWVLFIGQHEARHAEQIRDIGQRLVRGGS